MNTQTLHDLRSLSLHELVAKKIRQNPVLLDEALDRVQRWKLLVTQRALPYLTEWEQLIQSGMDACLTVATEVSEHANALRQSSPLSCVLSAKERQVFLKNWSITEQTSL